MGSCFPMGTGNTGMLYVRSPHPPESHGNPESLCVCRARRFAASARCAVHCRGAMVCLARRSDSNSAADDFDQAFVVSPRCRATTLTSATAAIAFRAWALRCRGFRCVGGHVHPLHDHARPRCVMSPALLRPPPPDQPARHPRCHGAARAEPMPARCRASIRGLEARNRAHSIRSEHTMGKGAADRRRATTPATAMPASR